MISKDNFIYNFDVNELINSFLSNAHWRIKSKADWFIREE